MKKFAITAGIVILVLALAVGAFVIRFNQMAQTITADYQKIGAIDFNQLADGVYAGTYGDFLVSVSLEVTIKDHRIESIVIKDQNSGPGYEALDTVDRIIKAQSPVVDAVSGATGSSRCISIAVHRALK